MREIIKQLVEARHKAGIVQVNLARTIGVSHTQLHNWETFKHRPRSDLLFAWASTLGYDLILAPKVHRSLNHEASPSPAAPDRAPHSRRAP